MYKNSILKIEQKRGSVLSPTYPSRSLQWLRSMKMEELEAQPDPARTSGDCYGTGLKFPNRSRDTVLCL